MIAAARSDPGQAITLDLLAVDAWAQAARASDWLAYAVGDRLDQQSPVAALVRGLVKGGGFATSEARDGAGNLQHRITRAEPSAIEQHWSSYHDARPAAPASLRSPPLDPAWMAYWASQGDEPAEWIAFALDDALRNRPIEGASPAEWADDRARLDPLLIALAEMLRPDGRSWLGLKIGRRAGAHREPKIANVRALQEAKRIEAAAIESAGSKRARHAASKATGKTERQIGASIERDRRAVPPVLAARARQLARLVATLCKGGMLRGPAEALAADALGFELSEARKWLRDKRFSPNA